MTDDDPSVRRQNLTEQADEILTSETDLIDLVSQLDLGYVHQNDEYFAWHASTDLDPMVRALLLKELEDYSNSELHRFLETTPEKANQLGFEEIPSRTTFGRTWRDRFDDDLKHTIQHHAKQIRELSRERGSSIGANALEPDDKSGVSRRTENRYIAQKAKEVTKEMQELVFPVFSFDRAENAHYDDDALLELQCHLGLSDSAAESGTKLFAQDTSRPEGAPDADTHLFNIKRLNHEQILEMVDEGISRMVHQAKHHLEFNRPAEVAIDMTYVAYYGDRDELEMVMGAPKNKAYGWCYKFATLTVVGENVKFTLAMTPVRAGYHVGRVVRELIWKAREHVSISTVYADREFCSVDTIRSFEEAGLDYVIPSPKNRRVKREIERMDRDVKVLNGYTMHGPVTGGSTNAAESTNMILLPSTKDDSRTVAFMTNKEVDDEISIDRREAKGIVNRYSRRWGIENSYKTIKDFLAWTTSKEFVVRLFYFGFAVLLYNMWLIVDFLVQISLDIQHRYKPRVTAKRFLNLARKYMTEPG